MEWKKQKGTVEFRIRTEEQSDPTTAKSERSTVHTSVPGKRDGPLNHVNNAILTRPEGQVKRSKDELQSKMESTRPEREHYLHHH